MIKQDIKETAIKIEAKLIWTNKNNHNLEGACTVRTYTHTHTYYKH